MNKLGRPAKDPIRGHQIRFGRIADELKTIMVLFDSQRDKQLIKDLLESLEPKKKCSL